MKELAPLVRAGCRKYREDGTWDVTAAAETLLTSIFEGFATDYATVWATLPERPTGQRPPPTAAAVNIYLEKLVGELPAILEVAAGRVPAVRLAATGCFAPLSTRQWQAAELRWSRYLADRTPPTQLLTSPDILCFFGTWWDAIACDCWPPMPKTGTND